MKNLARMLVLLAVVLLWQTSSAWANEFTFQLVDQAGRVIVAPDDSKTMLVLTGESAEEKWTAKSGANGVFAFTGIPLGKAVSMRLQSEDPKLKNVGTLESMRLDASKEKRNVPIQLKDVVYRSSMEIVILVVGLLCCIGAAYFVAIECLHGALLRGRGMSPAVAQSSSMVWMVVMVAVSILACVGAFLFPGVDNKYVPFAGILVCYGIALAIIGVVYLYSLSVDRR